MFSIIVIAGVIIAIIILVGVFANLDLADKAQALGLPKGSVRALVAFGALALYAVLAVSLLAWVDKPASPVHIFTETTIDKIKILDNSLLAAEREVSGKKQVEVVNIAAAHSAVDLAKQVLTTVASIMATIVGFYFGSRVAAQPAGGQGGKPAGGLTALTPKSAVDAAAKRVTKAKTRMAEISQAATAIRNGGLSAAAQLLARDNFATIEAVATRITGYASDVQNARTEVESALKQGDQTVATGAAQRARGRARAAEVDLDTAESALKRLNAIAKATLP